jgi:hypothetical protein
LRAGNGSPRILQLNDGLLPDLPIAGARAGAVTIRDTRHGTPPRADGDTNTDPQALRPTGDGGTDPIDLDSLTPRGNRMSAGTGTQASPETQRKFKAQFETKLQELNHKFVNGGATPVASRDVAQTYLSDLAAKLNTSLNDSSSHPARRAELAANIEILKSRMTLGNEQLSKTVQQALDDIRKYIVANSRRAQISSYFGWDNVSEEVESFMKGNYGSDDVSRRVTSMSRSPSRGRSSGGERTPEKESTSSRASQAETFSREHTTVGLPVTDADGAAVDPQIRPQTHRPTPKTTPRGVPTPQKGNTEDWGTVPQPATGSLAARFSETNPSEFPGPLAARSSDLPPTRQGTNVFSSDTPRPVGDAAATPSEETGGQTDIPQPPRNGRGSTGSTAANPPASSPAKAPASAKEKKSMGKGVNGSNQPNPPGKTSKK